MLVHALTINELAYVYRMLKMNDKLDFLKNYMGIGNADNRTSFRLSKILPDVVRIRNTINHYEPIIPLITQYKIENFDSLLNAVAMIWNLYIQSNDFIDFGATPAIMTIENAHNKKNLNKIKKIISILDKK